MALSNDLARDFATEVLNDEFEGYGKELTCFATAVFTEDGEYVRFDGSDILTPAVYATSAHTGDRVLVALKGRRAIVMSNITSPSMTLGILRAIEGIIVEGYLTTNAARLTYNDKNNYGVTYSKGGIGGSDGKGEFSDTWWTMTNDGLLRARGVDISGSLTAESGAIGGFTIADGNLYSGNHSTIDADVQGVFLSPAGISLGKQYKVTEDGVDKYEPVFKVDNNGYLHAVNATLRNGVLVAGAIRSNGFKAVSEDPSISAYSSEGMEVNLVTGLIRTPKFAISLIPFSKTINTISRSNLVLAFGNAFGVSSEGNIYAGNGVIGNFTLNNGTLYTNNHSSYNTNVNGVYLSSDYIALGPNGKFNVKNDGKLHAEDAEIVGSIETTSLTVNQTAYFKNSSVTTGNGYISYTNSDQYIFAGYYAWADTGRLLGPSSYDHNIGPSLSIYSPSPSGSSVSSVVFRCHSVGVEELLTVGGNLAVDNSVFANSVLAPSGYFNSIKVGRSGLQSYNGDIVVFGSDQEARVMASNETTASGTAGHYNRIYLYSATNGTAGIYSYNGAGSGHHIIYRAAGATTSTFYGNLTGHASLDLALTGGTMTGAITFSGTNGIKDASGNWMLRNQGSRVALGNTSEHVGVWTPSNGQLYVAGTSDYYLRNNSSLITTMQSNITAARQVADTARDTASGAVKKSGDTMSGALTFSGEIGIKNSSGKYLVRLYSNDYESNQTALGNGDHRTHIYSLGNIVYIGKDKTRTVSTTSSDRRLKDSFGSLDIYERMFMTLKPVSYRYKSDIGSDERIRFGFIAQDVRDSLIENGFNWTDHNIVVAQEGEPSPWEAPYIHDDEPVFLMNYENLQALNTHMIQKLYHRIAKLEAELDRLKVS